MTHLPRRRTILTAIHVAQSHDDPRGTISRRSTWQVDTSECSFLTPEQKAEMGRQVKQEAQLNNKQRHTQSNNRLEEKRDA